MAAGRGLTFPQPIKQLIKRYDLPHVAFWNTALPGRLSAGQQNPTGCLRLSWFSSSSSSDIHQDWFDVHFLFVSSVFQTSSSRRRHASNGIWDDVRSHLLRRRDRRRKLDQEGGLFQFRTSLLHRGSPSLCSLVWTRQNV